MSVINLRHPIYSILIGSLLFLGVGTAQATEEDHHTETKVQQLSGNQLGNDK